MTLAIIIGSWILGGIITYVLTPLFPWGTIYVDARDLRADNDSNAVVFTAVMWPLLITLILPGLGIYHLREWIKGSRLKRYPSIRVELDDDDDDDVDDEDDEDDDEDSEIEDSNLDYRTAPCHSCRHAVMKEP